MTSGDYVGRFAPSPTGPLHLGSLYAAVASYLQARSNRGRWLVRIEDLDPPREQAGAATTILRTLTHYGLHWDADVVYQSSRHSHYASALESLRNRDLCYPCACSRRDIDRSGRRGPLGIIYPGTCRTRTAPHGRPASERVLAPDRHVGFVDAVQGAYGQNLAREVGDFVILRRDGLWSYQLAVVVDDAYQGISEVVRGADLLDSTPRQLYLQEVLDLRAPTYLHLPVLVGEGADKLSKQNGAAPLPWSDPRPPLITILSLLGQHPPKELSEGTLDALWRWATNHWRPESIPRCRHLALASGTGMTATGVLPDSYSALP